MYQGIEGKTVAPRGREVVDFDSGVSGGRAAGPLEQHIPGGHIRFLAHHDVRYLEQSNSHL